MLTKYNIWQNERKIEKAAKALQKNGFRTDCVSDLASAKKLLFANLPQGVSVGLGGSETLSALDILPELRSGKYKLFDRYNADDHFEVCRQSLLAEYFITGTNAITMNGELVNLDCSGSRVAAIAYGPKKVIIVAGVNKIVDNIEQAIHRARGIAPMNCMRNEHETPCATTGFCSECNISDRMCNHLSITLNGQKFEDRFYIILVNEVLGF